MTNIPIGVDGNGVDEIEEPNAVVIIVTIENGDGSLIDTVAYRTTKGMEGWPGKVAGASFAFGRPAIDADANDVGSNWCIAAAPLGDGDQGTPGAANPKCFVDRCRMQWPLAVTALTNAVGPLRWYGHVHLAGVTDTTQGPDPDPLLVGAVGIGPQGSEPLANSDWKWTTGGVNPAWDDIAGYEPGNDEYQADAALPSQPGSYSVAFRFSYDGGYAWTYCDRSWGPGADGSEDGYQVDRASSLTINTP